MCILTTSVMINEQFKVIYLTVLSSKSYPSYLVPREEVYMYTTWQPTGRVLWTWIRGEIRIKNRKQDNLQYMPVKELWNSGKI